MISQICRAICCGSMGILRPAAGHGSRPGGLSQSRCGQGRLPELPRAVHQMSAWCGRAGSRALSLRNQPQIPARQSHSYVTNLDFSSFKVYRQTATMRKGFTASIAVDLKQHLELLSVQGKVSSLGAQVAIARVGQHVFKLCVPGCACGALCAPYPFPGGQIIYMHLEALIHHSHHPAAGAQIQAPGHAGFLCLRRFEVFIHQHPKIGASVDHQSIGPGIGACYRRIRE